MSLIDRILLVVALGNLVAFGLFALDKNQARMGGRRIAEHTLLAFVLIGGLGAWMAQHLLRHKTRKEPFRSRLGLLVTLYVLIIVGGAAWLIWTVAG